jgi:hypothetical protein
MCSIFCLLLVFRKRKEGRVSSGFKWNGYVFILWIMVWQWKPNLKLALAQEAEIKMRIVMIIVIKRELCCMCVLCSS